MAIQFNCSSCNAVLRVSDESAGKSARCPTCQSVQPIPGPSAPAAAEDPFGAFKSEFNEPPQAPSANPYAAPVTSHSHASVSAGGYQPTAADFGEAFSHAWQAFKPNIGVLVGATVILFGVSFLINVITSVFNAMGQQNDQMGLLLLGTLVSLFGSFLNMFLGIGMARICLGAARFQPVNVGMLFSGMDVILPVFGASILFAMGMFAGLLLLIIPGLIFMLLLWPHYYFIVDRQCGVMESFSRAFAVGKLNWLTSIVLAIAAMAIFVAGLLALGVGLLFAAPFVGVMVATTYLMMKGERPGQPGMPQSAF
nr:zinc-ribbon domain-containing protein [Rhodopirellula bahusiensis]